MSEVMSRSCQLWTLGVASPRGVQRVAQHAEAVGWDGLYVVDSQNLSGDCYVALTMAAVVTQRLGLGTGVTNSVTRTAASNACGIASVQRVSGGRAVLGIGRGDSALAHLGRAPARIAQFERYLGVLQGFLSGADVAFEDIDIPLSSAPLVASLELADGPKSSRMGWVADALKVPVEVAASGPKVIAIGARLADRVMFTLGASPERIRWGIGLARAARTAAGLDPAGVRFGAYVNLVCHPDRVVARQLVRGGLTTFARFSVMHGALSGPLDAAQREVLGQLRERYDMRAHTRADSQQAETLTDSFVDAFAIAGSAEHCVARLRELAALGLDRIAISGPTAGADVNEARKAVALLETEVLPVV